MATSPIITTTQKAPDRPCPRCEALTPADLTQIDSESGGLIGRHRCRDRACGHAWTARTLTAFATSDLSLCAALILSGYQPEHLVVDGKRHIFKFVDSTEMRAVIDAYTAGTLTGSLLAHSERVRELATMIRQGNRESRTAP